MDVQQKLAKSVSFRLDKNVSKDATGPEEETKDSMQTIDMKEVKQEPELIIEDGDNSAKHATVS